MRLFNYLLKNLNVIDLERAYSAFDSIIAYRGDSRSPEVIFNQGFKKSVTKLLSWIFCSGCCGTDLSFIPLFFFCLFGCRSTGDVCGQNRIIEDNGNWSVISLSRDFDRAAYFPLEAQETWVYIVLLPSYYELGKKANSDRVDFQEVLAVGEDVPNTAIYAAIRVTKIDRYYRQGHNDDQIVTSRGIDNLEIAEIRVNPNFHSRLGLEFPLQQRILIGKSYTPKNLQQELKISIDEVFAKNRIRALEKELMDCFIALGQLPDGDNEPLLTCCKLLRSIIEMPNRDYRSMCERGADHIKPYIVPAQRLILTLGIVALSFYFVIKTDNPGIIAGFSIGIAFGLLALCGAYCNKRRVFGEDSQIERSFGTDYPYQGFSISRLQQNHHDQLQSLKPNLAFEFSDHQHIGELVQKLNTFLLSRLHDLSVLSQKYFSNLSDTGSNSLIEKLKILSTEYHQLLSKQKSLDVQIEVGNLTGFRDPLLKSSPLGYRSLTA